MTPEQVEQALNHLHSLEQFTEEFLQPFMQTSFMETGQTHSLFLISDEKYVINLFRWRFGEPLL